MEFSLLLATVTGIAIAIVALLIIGVTCWLQKHDFSSSRSVRSARSTPRLSPMSSVCSPPVNSQENVWDNLAVYNSEGGEWDTKGINMRAIQVATVSDRVPTSHIEWIPPSLTRPLREEHYDQHFTLKPIKRDDFIDYNTTSHIYSEMDPTNNYYSLSSRTRLPSFSADHHSEDPPPTVRDEALPFEQEGDLSIISLSTLVSDHDDSSREFTVDMARAVGSTVDMGKAAESTVEQDQESGRRKKTRIINELYV